MAEDYDPTDRDRAYAYIREPQREGEVVTGLLYISPGLAGHARAERHRRDAARRQLPYEQLCPGNAELQKLQQRFR